MNSIQRPGEPATPITRKRPFPRERSASESDSDGESNAAINRLQTWVNELQREADEFHRRQTEHMSKLRDEIHALQTHRINRERKKTRRKRKQMAKKGNPTTDGTPPCQSDASALPTPPTFGRALSFGLSSCSHTLPAERRPQSGPPHQSPRKPGPDEGETPPPPPPPSQIFNFRATFRGECPTSDRRTASTNSDCTTTQSPSSEEDSDANSPVGPRPLRKRSSVIYNVAKLTMAGMGELDTPSQKKAELAYIVNEKGLPPSEEPEYSPGELSPPRKPPPGSRKRSRKVRSRRHDVDKPPPISVSRLSVEQRMSGEQPPITRFFSPWRNQG